ncbi:MAG: hypothetical protein ACTHM5_15710 [Ginsengibacter sp.]
MTGDFLDYLVIFFNSKLFRFCYKDNFPELLGETRELRKVFFEKINVKPVENDLWYKNILQQILDKIKSGLDILLLQNEIDEKLFDLYNLTEQERDLIL